MLDLAAQKKLISGIIIQDINMDFDIAIIGSGPGGYVAAIRASQLGFKVALIEKNQLGGICLNWGCIPTKALLNAAHLYHNIKHKVMDFGLNVQNVSFDLAKIVEYSRATSKKLSNGIEYLMNKNKITVYNSAACINSDKTISINKHDKIEAKHIIIATGAKPKSIPQLEFDHKLIWNYKDALKPTSVPKSIIIVGSGAIGIEFASFYNALNSEVTVIEIQSQILPSEDLEIAEIARKALEEKRIKILTDSNITDIQKNTNEIKLKANGQNISAEAMIVATGVTGNHENIGLDSFPNIKIEKNYIVVDGYGCTGETGIYAIGDVTGPPCLAHKASHEGVLCVEKIAGEKNLRLIDKLNIPGCIYSDPQIASIGFTEKQAKEQGYDIKIGRSKAEANGKSIVLQETVGLIKAIFDKKTGELLGAHMIGAEATELIQSYVVGKTLEATDKDLRHTIFPHPTLSEMIHESVLDADDESIHS